MVDESRRQIRVSPRLQVLHLCNLVDPPGDHPVDRDQARTIRIPVHMIETINKLVRTSRQICTRSAASRHRRSSRKARDGRSKRCARS